MENRENGRMILNSVQNGPLIWPTVTKEDDTIRTMKYEELSATKKIQADCDCKATNIVLQGLPPDVYAIVNHYKVAKEIWDRGETLYQYYWRFAQLINNLNVINMSMRAVQVNTKFLNSLPPEWSKFVTDVKLARDLHTTNYDQLYSYLKQHKVHANETRLMRERYQDPLAFVANYNQPLPQLTNYHSQYNPTYFPQPMYPPTHPSQPQINHSSIPPSHPYQSQVNHQTSYVPQITYHSPYASTQLITEFPQMDSSLVVPVFNQGDNLIACLNKAMDFLIAVASSRFPFTKKQLKTSSNPRNQAIIQDGRVTMQQVQGRQGQNYGDEEQLAFLTDPSIPNGQAAQTTIPNTVAFQIEDLDAYDSDCDDISNVKAVLMANLSSYGSDVLLDVPHSETSHNDMSNQNVHTMQNFEQTPIVDFLDNEITSDSNIIPYS
ncbi:hypothetical protein Tco_0459939 [Tanacetum coccineum]